MYSNKYVYVLHSSVRGLSLYPRTFIYKDTCFMHVGESPPYEDTTTKLHLQSVCVCGACKIMTTVECEI